MMGETLAIVLGDSKVWSAGLYWDRNKFTNRTLFAPFAYKTEENTRSFKMQDLARLNSTSKIASIAKFQNFRIQNSCKIKLICNYRGSLSEQTLVQITEESMGDKLRGTGETLFETPFEKQRDWRIPTKVRTVSNFLSSSEHNTRSLDDSLL